MSFFLSWTTMCLHRLLFLIYPVYNPSNCHPPKMYCQNSNPFKSSPPSDALFITRLLTIYDIMVSNYVLLYTRYNRKKGKSSTPIISYFQSNSLLFNQPSYLHLPKHCASRDRLSIRCRVLTYGTFFSHLIMAHKKFYIRRLRPLITALPY